MTAYETARKDSLAAALTELYAPLDAVPFGPEGHAVVPRALAPAGWSTVDNPVLDGEGLVGLRHVGLRHEGGPPPVPPDLLTDLLTGLAWVRLGLSARLLDDCVSYLDGRTVGGAPLLDQQLVRGDLADAATTHEELAVLLDGTPPDPADLPWLHRRLTRVDRLLLRLLGASGFLAGGPGQRAAASELVSDAYVPGDPP
jgi:alkylation response protein AidB-like acyl-CoA dehydrogenase